MLATGLREGEDGVTNRRNHRRDENRRMEHGPRWEHPDPGKGCNSTHVARSRRDWKRIEARRERRRLEREAQAERQTVDAAGVGKARA